MAAALAVLASVLAGSAPGEDARTVESRLDARLRLIHRAEREAVSAGGERAEAGRERVAALVARLGGRARGEGLAFAAPPPI